MKDSLKYAMKFSVEPIFYIYINYRIHIFKTFLQCLHCNDKFEDFDVLFKHMKSENHLKPPEERDEWDSSQYYFPTYENDNFLCLIEVI